MFRNKNPNSANPIVKLFPRLAPAVLATQVRIERKLARERRSPGSVTLFRQNERAQVRARLLRMILDNERSRHNDPRPNAS